MDANEVNRKQTNDEAWEEARQTHKYVYMKNKEQTASVRSTAK